MQIIWNKQNARHWPKYLFAILKSCLHENDGIWFTHLIGMCVRAPFGATRKHPEQRDKVLFLFLISHSMIGHVGLVEV